MGVVLVNGNGNPAVYAAQDSDLLGGISGQATGILDINDKFSATIADANTVEISSGVCITKEGRRIQIDVGDVEEVIVPTGSQGTTKYYIIGFHLYTDGSGNQLAETFIDEVESSTATITENMFKDGETEVYVSLYRITRNGLNLEDLTLILPEIPSLGDLKEEVAELSTDLSSMVKIDVLWENNSPTSNFGPQTIQLSNSISEYRYYEVTFVENKSYLTNIATTGLVPSDENAFLSMPTTFIGYRKVTGVSGTDITFGNGILRTTYGGPESTHNDAIIPLKVIGVK